MPMSDESFSQPIDLRKDGSGMIAYGNDDGMIVLFHEENFFMEYLSKVTGSPIYQMRIYTRITMPGNRNTMWDHLTEGVEYEVVEDPETHEYHTSWHVLEVCENGSIPEPIKYPKAWARFLKKNVEADIGYPIEQWGTVTRSYAQSLKAQNVHSVEALAALTDQQAQNIMGAPKYRDLAKAFLDERQRTMIISREQERAAKFQELSETQAKQIAEMRDIMQNMQAQMANQPGAPPPKIDRRTSEYRNAQTEMKQMTRKQANKKHQIPSEAA
jgi:hypothetical protein